MQYYCEMNERTDTKNCEPLKKSNLLLYLTSTIETQDSKSCLLRACIVGRPRQHRSQTPFPGEVERHRDYTCFWPLRIQDWKIERWNIAVINKNNIRQEQPKQRNQTFLCIWWRLKIWVVMEPTVAPCNSSKVIISYPGMIPRN